MKTLTSRTIESLRSLISDGALQVGDKLPTLAVLCGELGVSRTVLREAIASLRSEGILEAKHGVGVFIRDKNKAASTDRQSSTLEPLGRLALPFMDPLELRMAFEVHAAGLAAQRRSWAQEANLWDAHKAFEAAVEDEEQDLDAHDFAFHRSIAEATNNSAFIEFFSVMSLKIMPQQTFSRTLHPALITREYVQNTVVEHRAIADAISIGDAEQARKAMQAHLTRSHHRYRGFDGAAK